VRELVTKRVKLLKKRKGTGDKEKQYRGAGRVWATDGNWNRKIDVVLWELETYERYVTAI
jgi:hypothetical protein